MLEREEGWCESYEFGAKSRLRVPERRAVKKSIRDIERSRVGRSRDRESTVREFASWRRSSSTVV
jgi:hypothetical protein